MKLHISKCVKTSYRLDTLEALFVQYPPYCLRYQDLTLVTLQELYITHLIWLSHT